MLAHYACLAWPAQRRSARYCVTQLAGPTRGAAPAHDQSNVKVWLAQWCTCMAATMARPTVSGGLSKLENESTERFTRPWRTRLVTWGEQRCNTPCYGSPNLTLITVISGLVMHDTTGLINSESSQRYFWFKMNLNYQIWTKRFLVCTSNSYPWVGLDTRCNQQLMFPLSSKFKVSRRNYINFSQILT
jgi:hypothetical protein